MVRVGNFIWLKWVKDIFLVDFMYRNMTFPTELPMHLPCSTDVSKIDGNYCKQTLASLPCFWAYR